eukprot:TRINITY_DN24747_c0_g1_i1.p1 TRINITY_DN24747_c0_g1~~TRINITY_DN24747_c0_g1_i1.p1  ORF type:complete len:431 (+),score=97.28 TRINITY_DN24747_c0_g1_i1:58-1350(+)
MPVDIKLLREQPELFRESQRRRARDAKVVDDVLAIDEESRAATTACNSLRRDLDTLQKKIAVKKKASKGKDACSEELAEKEALEVLLEETKAREAAHLEARSKLVATIGNLVHDAVPVAASEDGNLVLRTWGTPRAISGVQTYWEILRRLGAYDPDRGTRVAGRRGYFLQGPGVLLNMALQNYGMTFLAQRGYLPMQPPFFMRREVMGRTAELKDFDDQLYSVSSRGGEEAAYLIATSEQPLSAYHQDEWMEPATLPLKYAGVSSCFRAETSSSGSEAKGLFRIHQFEKVEQFCISSPEASDTLLQEMLALSEEFYQSLGVPYQIVAIASGGLNDAASIKYDLEAWFPSENKCRELVSCSNCTDYQARALGVRIAKDTEKRFVHMLNATLCATERTICCLVENFQEKDGVRIPPALQPYMHGKEFIAYIG